ncbi:uncharacterized protein N7529_007548 [Penicillium soppii]|uniref:uncharacterized protein n=1 Tax=Penicillium soppii TaxID=69789 RepID=UPI00254741CC|nr:uncharacterized protein N7529_007548 [Penicillium soppii]KAJ5860238.1 hypothetical protein N7529_007548 [Penicillium soppii]
MSSIITSIKDLIASVFEVIFAVFHTALDTTTGLLKAIVDFFVDTIRLAFSAVGNVLGAAGGVGKFVASNIVVIAIIAGGAYGFLRYQSRQGRPVRVGDKKLN